MPELEPRRVATPVSQLDVTPALLDLLDLEVPEHVQGRTLRPLLTAGDTAPDEAEVFIEWNGLPRQIRQDGTVSESQDVETRLRAVDVRTIRRGRWKLNIHLSGEHELYDLQDDPGELHNAIRDPGNRPIARSLYQRLLAWQRETNDPLVLPDPLGAAPRGVGASGSSTRRRVWQV